MEIFQSLGSSSVNCLVPCDNPFGVVCWTTRGRGYGVWKHFSRTKLENWIEEERLAAWLLRSDGSWKRPLDVLISRKRRAKTLTRDSQCIDNRQPTFPSKSERCLCVSACPRENLLTHPGSKASTKGEQVANKVTVTAFPMAQRRHQIEIRRKFASLLSICRSQTMRDPTTDVAEPRPFHVPLIDTLGPVRCGVATVMSSSLRVPPHYQRRLEIHRLTDLSDIARYFSLK